jgi:hypothetical protein
MHQGFSGGGELQSDDGADVTRLGVINGVLLDGVQLDQARGALFLAVVRADQRIAALDGALIDAHEGQFACAGHVHDLENQGP